MNEKKPDFLKYRARAASLLLLGALAAGNAWSYDAAAEPPFATGGNPSSSMSYVYRNPLLYPDVDVLAVDTPDGKPTYSDTTITDAVDDADKKIRLATSGDVRFPLHDISHISIQPKGRASTSDRGSIPCYTYEQAESAIRSHRLQSHLGESALVMLVFDGVKGCSYYPSDTRYAAGGYKGSLDGQPYIVENELGHEVHELGHALGLAHTKQINTYTADGRPFQSTFDAVDFAPMRYELSNGLSASDNRPKSNAERLRLKEYSSKMSVMGSLSKNERKQLFTADELYNIDPERFKIIDIANEPAEYTLSMSPGGAVGVRIPVDPESTLKQLDPEIDSVVIGLDMSQYDETAQNLDDPTALQGIVVSSKTKNSEYTLRNENLNTRTKAREYAKTTNFLGPKTLEVMTFGEFSDYVYVDSAVDIIVSVAQNEQGDVIVKVDNKLTSKNNRLWLKKEMLRRLSS